MRLLALIPEASCTRACLDAAAAAAGIDPAARIEALHVKVDPRVAGRLDEEVALYQARDHYEGSADERARATWAEFEAWIATAPPEIASRIDRREVAGCEQTTVVREASGTGLLVMARPHDLDGHDALYAALFMSGKPLLLVPGNWKSQAGASLERHMLIAWKPTVQARRAVAGALPWLRYADKVTVLTVTKRGEHDDPSELLALLAREGVTASALKGEAINGRTSARILAAAGELAASCIVMGAYRHDPLVEWVLGATTRRVFADTPLPVLTAH